MDLLLDALVPLPYLEEVARRMCAGHDWRLLRSGRRHHLYGVFDLSESDWLEWIGRFQHPVVLADPRYLRLCERWQCSLLRLSEGPGPWAVVPHTLDVTAARGEDRMVEAAVRLAHTRHAWQERPDGEPVVSHLSTVATLAMHIRMDCLARGAVTAQDGTPQELYACGYLHACLDDTDTEYEDIANAAGERVAAWVAELSTDKRRPRRERRHEYEAQLQRASRAARTVKLADVLADLRAIAELDGGAPAMSDLDLLAGQLHQVREGLESCAEYREAERLLNDCQRKPA